MQCNDLADLFERDGLSALPPAAQSHLAVCPHCREFLADLNAIVTVAHEFPAEVEPPARVWISLRSQLVSEGLIRETTSQLAPQRTSWWPNWSPGFAGLFQGRALATAAVGLLIAAAAIVQLERPSQTSPAGSPAGSVADVAPDSPDAQAAQGSAPRDEMTDSVAAVNEQEHELRSAQTVGTLGSSPVDDSLQKDLVTLDAFIAECEHHLKSHPRDQLAREYLARAYQQKAELLSAMLDRGRSVN
jgi:ribosomal protein S15P/S13E